MRAFLSLPDHEKRKRVAVAHRVSVYCRSNHRGRLLRRLVPLPVSLQPPINSQFRPLHQPEPRQLPQFQRVRPRLANRKKHQYLCSPPLLQAPPSMWESHSIPASDPATAVGTALIHSTLSSMPCGPFAAAVGPSFAAPSTFSSRVSTQPGDPNGFLAKRRLRTRRES
ncbi:hypothetical protein BHE74_00032206 [Ensete ventricosum]|nr:hypothetical protein BHE74_00032206 [Ensete ventricosum]RZS02785.1 hypothetical protein BHM03_00032875 [Ensete ventricosum]